MHVERPNQGSILIRSVWSSNLDREIELISSLVDDFPYAAMDTEFPGNIFRHDSSDYFRPHAFYSVLKSNVDDLNLIQFGLTLADREGNLPNLGTSHCYIWEFNFSDFDVERDKHARESIALLRRQGIDFEKNRECGIKTVRFAELVMSSGLVCNEDLSWVTFHSAYDFGYLVKALTQRSLPEGLDDFLILIKVFFGERIYDVKHLMKFCDGLYGGLNRIGNSLGLGRMVGKSHQAGSDSLLTLQSFEKIRKIYFCDDDEALLKYAGVLFGLNHIS